MMTVLKGCTTVKQRSVVRFFLWTKGPDAKAKCFLFTVGTVCCVKRFHLGDKHFADDEEFETQARK
jgi:hypothetical protein